MNAFIALLLTVATPVPDALLSPGREGQGNVEAKEALVAPGDVMAMLAAMEGASPLGGNYLRSAIEMVAERDPEKLPRLEMARFLLDRSNPARGREMAYRLLASAEPAATAEMVPGFLNDSVPALRLLAVDQLMARAAQIDGDGLTLVYLQALGAARDVSQVKEIAKMLEERGEKVDLAKQFGFLTTWQLSAPYDNKGGLGFEKPYPPEEGGDAEWKEVSTDHEFGEMSFNAHYGHEKGVVGYARTVLKSEQPQEVQFRLGTQNAWKLWLNGELVFAREEYHRGMKIDQYVLPATLAAGENTVLLKVCQNEGTNSWEDPWVFQLRVTDREGEVLRFTP